MRWEQRCQLPGQFSLTVSRGYSPGAGSQPVCFHLQPQEAVTAERSGPCERKVGKDAGTRHWKLGTWAENPQIQVGEEERVRQREQPVWGTSTLAGEARQPRSVSWEVSLEAPLLKGLWAFWACFPLNKPIVTPVAEALALTPLSG